MLLLGLLQLLGRVLLVVGLWWRLTVLRWLLWLLPPVLIPVIPGWRANLPVLGLLVLLPPLWWFTFVVITTILLLVLVASLLVVLVVVGLLW